MKHDLLVGDLVGIDPGYSGGIWLRREPTANISTDSGHVMSGTMIILQLCSDKTARDASVKVVSSCGKVGWTFASRLRKTI